MFKKKASILRLLTSVIKFEELIRRKITNSNGLCRLLLANISEDALRPRFHKEWLIKRTLVFPRFLYGLHKHALKASIFVWIVFASIK